MKFLRKIKEVTWEDQIRNEVIRNELQVEPLEEKQEKYKRKWMAPHLERMNEERITKSIRNYMPRRWMSIDGPRKR